MLCSSKHLRITCPIVHFDTETRVTAALAEHRNEIVAALADEAYFAHVTPGGHSARLAQRISQWQSSSGALRPTALLLNHRPVAD